MRLAGKTILITAAGQGIGRASAVACAREGANVIATDIQEAALQGLAAECPNIRTELLNVLDGAAIDALAEALPSLDGLFNCAGYVHHGSVLECMEADWDFSFELNVKSAYRTVRAFLPSMLAHVERTGGSASVINMASMASSIKGFPNRLAYGASKGAVIGLTKALAADHVKQQIRFNALCPGTVDTPSLRQRINASPDPVLAEKAFIARQPMGRLAQVEDITPQVVYLLSDESRFVTGQAISVDGGVTI